MPERSPRLTGQFHELVRVICESTEDGAISQRPPDVLRLGERVFISHLPLRPPLLWPQRNDRLNHIRPRGIRRRFRAADFADHLVHLGEAAHDHVAHADIIARLGGDEFTVLAINAPKETAETILARLQEHVQKQNGGGQPYQLSLSVGVARYDPQADPTDLDELLARADKDLYAHKESKKTQAYKSPE